MALLFSEAYPLPQLPAVAQRLLAALPQPGPVAVQGEMGAGKTTLVTALCQLLGAQVAATSPTFTLIQEYPAPTAPGGRIYHLDLYRLPPEDALPQALDLGLTEVLDSGAWCFIEWAERIAPLLQEVPHLLISLEITGPETRKMQAVSYLNAAHVP